MNKKNKILLTSVGLAMLSGIAATSSTFAWFTTTRTASISYSDATVTSAQGDLQLTYLGSPNNFSTKPADNTIGNTVSLVGGNNITDISGDGTNFFKPTWSSVEGIASKIDAVSTAEGSYIEINTNVKNKGTASMNVYLGTGTEITSANADAKNASRMAVLVDSALTIMYAPDTADTAHSYLNAASATAVKVFGSGTGTAATRGNYGGTVLHTFATANLIADAVPASKVATLAAGAAANVTFRVWLEGEDLNAVNDAISGALAIAINLYGIDA